MDELRLLARSVFVLNENNKVVYKEIVSEGTNYPDFCCIKSLQKYLVILNY